MTWQPPSSGDPEDPTEPRRSQPNGLDSGTGNQNGPAQGGTEPTTGEPPWAVPPAPPPPPPPPPAGPPPAYPPSGPPAYPPPEPPAYPPPEPPTYQGYQQPPYQPPGYGTPSYQPPYGVVETRRTNGLAIAALVCSLAGFFTGISAPVGAVLGHIALRQIGQTGEEGAGLAKAAIIVGWIITGLIVLTCCIAGIAIIAATNTNT